MAITWAGARTKVRGDLWRPGSSGVPDDVCDRALHSSLLELEAVRRWLWLQNLSTTPAVVTPADNIAVSANLRSVSSVAYINGQSNEILTVAPLARIRELARGASAGAPTFYALHDSKLYFDTLIPAGGQFELIATHRTPQDLTEAVAAGDTNATLDQQEQAIIANACHYVALSYLKNEAEAARQRAVYDRIESRLIDVEDEARSDLHGGGIIPDTAYRDAAFGAG